mgnify:CR=1 FL=1
MPEKTNHTNSLETEFQLILSAVGNIESKVDVLTTKVVGLEHSFQDAAIVRAAVMEKFTRSLEDIEKLKTKVEGLETFATKWKTIFLVVHFIWGVLLALFLAFKKEIFGK